MNYIIVIADSTYELENRVRSKLLERYKPTGGVAIRSYSYSNKITYMQAMWKE